MKPLLRCAIICLATIVGGCLPEVDTVDPSTIVEWKNFMPSDGLAGTQVNFITEDSQGYLWIATDNGVSKFDGISFTNYRTQNGLLDNFVTSIVEFEPGFMVFGTDAGITTFDGTSWEGVYFDANTPYGVLSMAVDEDDIGWVATDYYGLLFTDGSNWWQIWDDQCYYCNFVNTMFLDSKGTMWFGGTQDGLKSLQKGASNFKLYTTSNGLPDNYIQAVYEDSWGEIWVGTYDGLAKKNNNRFEEISLYNSADQNWAYTLNQDVNYNLWIGTIGNGLARFDGTVMRTEQATLTDERSSTISSFRSSDGTLWFGTYEGGLWKYNPSP